jgi:FkbM family methyltransferase
MSIHKYKNIVDACQQLTVNKRLRTIVDLGSRHGECYTSFGKDFPEAKFFFVEPSDRCIPHIRDVMNKYADRDLHLIEGVLGIEEKQVEFFQFENDDDQSGNLYSDRQMKYGALTTKKVNMLDFRKVFNFKIDFVKCNIEGGEYALIEQGFFDNVETFVMEAHNLHIPGKTYKDVVASLTENFDLEVWGSLDNKYCFVNGNKKI